MTSYCLMKSEGDCYPITQLETDKETPWTGVRNYQARNTMLKLSVGDKVLFYHSNIKDKGIYGLAEVSHIARPDITAQDPHDEHYDSKATPENPIWQCVTVKHITTWRQPVLLTEIHKKKELQNMEICKRGSRLSVTPVTQKDYETICTMYMNMKHT